MEKANEGRPAASPAADVDWFGFNQNGRAQKDVQAQQGPNGDKPGNSGRAPEDPYSDHQGPKNKGDKTENGGKPGHGKNDKVQPLYLYDVAEHALIASGKKNYRQDDIYFKLNEIMVAHNYQKANIDGRTNINDHMLPKSWNNVDPHKLMGKSIPEDHGKDQPKPGDGQKPGDQKPGDQKPGDQKPGDQKPDKVGTPDDKNQSPEQKARADYQKQVEKALADKFALPPIKAGKGYYDAVAEAHPDWKAAKVLEEARRVRKLNDNRLDLSVGERVFTIGKDERAKYLAEAMQAYDEKQKQA